MLKIVLACSLGVLFGIVELPIQLAQCVASFFVERLLNPERYFSKQAHRGILYFILADLIYWILVLLFLPLYPICKAIVYSSASQSRPLHPRERAALEGYFLASHIAQIRIVPRATGTLLWKLQSLLFNNAFDAAAFTFEHRLFTSTAQLSASTLRHETAHYLQYYRRGTVSFLCMYFSGFSALLCQERDVLRAYFRITEEIEATISEKPANFQAYIRKWSNHQHSLLQRLYTRWLFTGYNFTT